ncbi:MAG: hypothetical protein E3J35_00995 [Methanomassiliicoccales archaeon]|nr:MAG: hypothetical protein E3J35_00995 [Methanomassiliicoccales archaeon]
MYTRATILIRGDVQEVGYRGFIQERALELKLVGYVENLADCRVKAVCEGEKEAIQNFCREIRIHDDFVNVKSVRKRFAKPTREFKRFEVRTDDSALETFRGYATAGKYFRHLAEITKCVGEKVEGVGKKVEVVGEKVEGVGKKVESVGEKVEGVGNEARGVRSEVRGVRSEVKGVGTNIDAMHKSMNQRFDKMDDSYGRFASKMDSLDNHITEIRDDFRVFFRHMLERDTKAGN